MDLLDVIRKAASSVCVTVPASESAKGHRRIDDRARNEVLPWVGGRRPQLRNKRVVPLQTKAAKLTYADLGSPSRNRGEAAFNSLVHSGLQSMPHSSFGASLSRGLQGIRSDVRAAMNKKPEVKTFWGELTSGRPWSAVDAYNENELRKSWARRLGEGTGAAAEGAINFVPGAGWGAAVAKGVAQNKVDDWLPGPGFWTRMVYAPLAMNKTMFHDIPSDIYNYGKAMLRNREYAETDPAQIRRNAFKRIMNDGSDWDTKAYSLRRNYPDLWQEWQAGRL